jgi:serine/threonine-protein kinase
VARFTREAQALAALNHPHIAAIYGVEERALVMELVEGANLPCPVPIEQAVSYAKQIAEALEAAHEKGIVHRDLKPANIKVTPEGTVKVLDFGLAAVTHTDAVASGNPQDSPTLTMMGATQAGVILGTASYMAPEQAAGKPVDRRSDIWSFGVVLYEMLTGKRLFDGETQSHTLASVLQAPIDFDALPKGTPAAVKTLLKRCLDRNTRTRLRDIGEARVALENAKQEPEIVAAAPRVGWLWPAATAAAMLAAALLLIRDSRGGRLPTYGAVRSTVELNPAAQLWARTRPYFPAMAFSPDGKTLVFSGEAGGNGNEDYNSGVQLYKRALDQAEAVPIPGTSRGIAPFFSPDGQWIAFFAGRELQKVSIHGGPPTTICQAASGDLPIGGTWGDGNSIIFVRGSMFKVSADGGAPQVLLDRNDATGAVFGAPEFLPDGRTLLFTRRNGYWDEAEIDVLAPGGTPRTLLKGANPRYMPGYLTFLRMGALLAVPFDPAKAAVSGSPVALLDGVLQSMGNSINDSSVGQFAVSSSGALVYASGGISPPRTGSVVQIDRKGEIIDLNIHEPFASVRLSPDGQRFAAYTWTANQRERDPRIYNLAGGTVTRVTRDKVGHDPIWSPDGSRVAFVNGQHSLVVARADAHGPPETIVAGNPSVDTIPQAWSPDGKWLLYILQVPRSKTWVKAMDGSATEPRALSESDGFQDLGFSPDGKWISYRSFDSGQVGLYIQAFPGPGEKIRFASGTVTNPVWAPSGRELFYMMTRGVGGKMMSVGIQLGDHPRAGAPRELFSLPDGFTGRNLSRAYDVYPDGQHFLVPLLSPPPKDPPITRLHLVMNWIDEVRRRVPVR